ncbi:MAG: response regulator transcription factor [Acidimicrobiia bacterium]
MTRAALGRQISVLLADDDPRFRALVRGVLVEDGYAVVSEAGTSAEVLSAVGVEPPDVVVLDLVMDGAVGLSTLDRLRAAHPGLPVVVISSLFDPVVEQQILARGARYLEKVEGIEALEQAIDAVATVDRGR